MGTASARPDKLQAFVTAGGEIRGELQRRINALRASYDSFQASGGSYPVANPDLMDVELPGFITNYANDETFVAVVRQAFIDADPSYGATGGLAEVGSRSFDTAFRAAARRAGIDPDALLAFRAPATVDEPVAAGIPRTSGFVADPVCTATGHFVEAEDDFTWPDRLAVLRWQRTYSSRFVASGPFGRGWASWATVMLLPQDDGAVAYQGPDGQIALFYPAIGDNGSDGGVDTSDDGSDRTYARVSGVAAELTRVDGGTGWQLTWDWASDHPGEVWTFDGGAGRLQTVTGETVGTTTFVYEAGLLVAVEHDGGRRLDVEWSGDRIAAVRSSCGREARYHYDDAGDLARTERVLGDRRYTTDDQGLVVEVWDADGVRLCHNTYDDDGRVLTQLSPFGRETVFRYEPGNRTVVSDTTDGPVTTYEHDRVGRLVGLIDDHGHHMQRSFDAEGRCVAATGFDGGAATHTFSADGRSATSVGADGVFERWEYDDQRRVVRQQVDGGPELSFDYEGSRAVPTRMSGPDGWEVRFAIDGGLVRSMTDADGVRLAFDHDDDGNVVAVRNGVGAETRTVPHVSGEAAAVTLPDGATVECDRDGAGRLLAVRTPVGDEYRLEWSPAGRMTAMVEPNGARTTFDHGSHGGVERVVDAVGSAVEMQHDQLERLVGLSVPGGAKWGFSYSALGLLSLVHDPSGGTWAYEYDAEGRAMGVTDPLGHELRHRYDAAGRLAEVIDQSGNATRYSHDALGRLASTEDPEGGVTAYEWDVWGRPTAVRAPDGGSLTYEYTPAGRVRSVRTAAGRGWTAEYDVAGRLVATTDAAGATTRLEWDVCDRVVAVVSPSGRRESYGYDAAGRQVLTERGGRQWHTAYDHAGRAVETTDPLGATTRYEYDLRGKLVAATDPLGDTVRIRYDERGNAVAIVDAAGGLTATAYDEMRRRVAVTDRLGRTTRVDRDAAGRPVRQELPTGDVVSWQRDPRGLATDVQVNGVDTIVFDRDRTGRPLLIHEPRRNRTFTFAWSRGGRLASLDVDDGRSLGWEYDQDGLPSARHGAGGRATRFERDAAGRLVAVVDDRSGRVELDRDADGRLTAMRAAGVQQGWDHDAGGLVVGYRSSGDAGDQGSELVRDAAGRIVEVRGDAGVTRYRYDGAGQLLAASGPAGAWVWQYDPGGRLTREEGPAGTRTFRYDGADQLVRIDGPGGSTVFGYDDAGRRTSEDGPAGTRRYAWDALGRLSSISVGERDLDVDVDALRHLAAFDGTPLAWDPTGPVPDLISVGDRHVVGAAGLPLGVSEPDGATTWLRGGWQGPAAGAEGRDPWGAALPDHAGTDPATAAPAPGFLGELDLGGLLWLRSRVYDPATRQFLSPDPIAGVPGLPVATNPYHYANNDPVGFVDPLGLQPLSIDAYNEIREQETSVQWGNIAMVGLTAASFFIPGGPIIATLVGAGIGMAPGIANGIATGNWDVGGIIKGGVVGGIAGRVGFAFGGGGTTMLGAMARGGAAGAGGGTAGEAYDMLPLPGSDGSFDIENVAVSTALGAGTGGAAYRLRPPPTPTQTVYRFHDASNPQTLRSRLSSAPPGVQAAERLRLQDPDYVAWRADAHMRGAVQDSPFVSVIDTPMGAVTSTDDWIRTIATGQPGAPGVQRAPDISRFEVPSDRLIGPEASNKLSLAEGERLYLGDDLERFRVDTVPNPYY